IQPFYHDTVCAWRFSGIELKRRRTDIIGNDIGCPMDRGTQIFHTCQGVYRSAVVWRVKLAHGVISLWAMGNHARRIAIAAKATAIAPFGGDDDYPTASHTTVYRCIADTPQYFNSLHVKHIDH